MTETDQMAFENDSMYAYWYFFSHFFNNNNKTRFYLGNIYTQRNVQVFSAQSDELWEWIIPMHPRASQVALVVKNPPANASDIRDMVSIPESGKSPGEVHGNPLQYFWLENPKDRGTWQASVHSVAGSKTQLKQLSSHTPMQPVFQSSFIIFSSPQKRTMPCINRLGVQPHFI